MSFKLVILACFVMFALCYFGTNAAFCPGHRIRCRDTQTCCQAKTGYACCPYQNATCCADEQHCCPQNTDCDSAHRRCVPRPQHQHEQISWTNVNVNAEEDINEIMSQTCPGGVQSCPDTYTCCEMATGGYGCCPMQGAVCCSDKVHCCPSGTTCDVQHGGCSP